jgi:translation elongation factor aEF-1 beta
MKVRNMGEVAITYKILAADVEEIDYDSIMTNLNGLGDETYNIQLLELKPLAFGLKYIQMHVVMNDGEGLVDAFEHRVNGIVGIGEVEVLEMGLL